LVVAALSSWHVVAVAVLTFFLVTPSTGLSPGSRRWQGRVAGMLGNRVMTFLADVSYSVYLLHSLVIAWAGRWLLGQTWFEAMPGRTRVLVLLAAVVVITYPIAFLLHHLVERPGIEVGRRLARQCRNSHIDGSKAGA
jgi:peptidoglycan/LPS O-acetylase OafA/YrhL